MARAAKFKPTGEDENPVQAWYDALALGSFSGNPPMLQWIGADMWLFHPDKEFPFTFTRGNGEPITVGQFRDKMVSFGTDGGSIPDYIRGLPNLSRWHYGAAYLIHDWLWHIHKQGWGVYTFQETNIILCEAVKTLIETGYVGHDTFKGDAGTTMNIHRGVSSFFGHKIWSRE